MNVVTQAQLSPVLFLTNLLIESEAAKHALSNQLKESQQRVRELELELSKRAWVDGTEKRDPPEGIMKSKEIERLVDAKVAEAVKKLQSKQITEDAMDSRIAGKLKDFEIAWELSNLGAGFDSLEGRIGDVKLQIEEQNSKTHSELVKRLETGGTTGEESQSQF
jgi:hypothetical protein